MKNEWKEKLLWSKGELQLLNKRFPDDQLILSAISQIEYLEALNTEKNKDDSDLEKIDLGYLAMYSLSDIVSYDLSVALCDISDKIRRDLRRQGRKLNIDQR